MRFLTKLGSRPENEKSLFMAITGYRAENRVVPILIRKSLDEGAVCI